MRTTLDLDPEVLAIARSIATERKQSLGKVVSEIFLRNLEDKGRSGQVRNGVRVIKRRKGAAPVTLAAINALRDEV